MFRFTAVIAEFLAQLHNHLVERPSSAIIMITPYFIEQAVARENFTRMRAKQLQQLQLFRGEFLGCAAAANFERPRVDLCLADLE